MWELDHKETWAPKNWCFWTVMLEKTLGSPLDCKEIKPVHPKGNQPWIFIGRTEAEAPILWPSDAKSWLIGKDPDTGKDWRQEEKGMTEDEMVGWHHWLSGHEFEQTWGDSEGQRSLVCGSPGGCKELDTAEPLNNNTHLVLESWLVSGKTQLLCKRWCQKISYSAANERDYLLYPVSASHCLWAVPGDRTSSQTFLAKLAPVRQAQTLPTPAW